MARLRISEVAREKGVSMGELSRLSNVTIAAIRRAWRNPDYDISFSTLKKIAHALGVRVCDLIEEEDGQEG